MKRLALIVALAATMGVVFLLPVMAERADRRAPREIVLVARDMAFFEAGESDPNPSIRVKAGERVVITVRNDEPGMTHDFAIAAWGAATRSIKAGSTDQIIVTVPEKPGTAEYVCRPHSVMMRGVLIVE